MHPLEVEREAGRRQVAPEARQQPVVAAAAAEHVAERRVVDLEDRAAVVAEVAQQAEVDLHPLGGAAPLELVEGPLQPRRGALHRLAAHRARLLQHLAAAAKLREGDQGRALLVADALGKLQLLLQPDEVVHRELLQQGVAGLALDPQLRQRLAVEVGVAEPDHRPPQADRVQRRLQHLHHLGGPPGASGPINSTPAWANWRIWPRCGRTAR